MRQYLLIIFFICSAFNQELEPGDIIVSKNDLNDIAQSLINAEDYRNAIAIYQQILDYQINSLGLNDTEVANTSLIIGELMIRLFDFEDAEMYIKQSINIKSKILLDQQIGLIPSLEYLREVYDNNEDSLKVDFIDKQLNLLSETEFINSNNEDWTPIIYGLDQISDQMIYDISTGDEYNYQSMNLMNIADSYFNAGLYYDGIYSVVKAISVDDKYLTIDFLYSYIDQHISETPQMINALVNYSNQDSLSLPENKLFLSMIHYYREEKEIAHQYINDYIATNTHDYRGFQLLGDYHLNGEEYLSALYNYRKSQQISPDNLYTLLQSSICLYNIDQKDEAIEILSILITNDRYNYYGYYYRGLSYADTKNYRNAIKDFTEYILLNPDDEDVYYYLGLCYFHNKQYHRANESLLRYLKYNNENGDAHYFLGMINENILEFDNAIDHYTLARKFNPDLDNSNLRLGLLHYKNKNYNYAVEPLRDYIITNPDSIHVLETFAEVLVYEGRYPESIDAYYKLYESDPTNSNYLLLIANSYIELGNIVNAKNLLTKLILIGEVNSEVLLMLANIENQLSEHDNAISHYIMAIQMGNPSIEMYYNLAMSYAQVENYMQALLAFQNAHTLNPDNNELVFQISMCYKELQIYDQAILHLETFIKELPGDYLAHHLIGELYFLIDEYDIAQLHFTKSLSLNSQDYLSLYFLGMCNLQKNNYINAAKFFKKSIKIEPDNPQTHFDLALTYHALGKNREVKKEMNIIYMLDQGLHTALKDSIEKK